MLATFNSIKHTQLNHDVTFYKTHIKKKYIIKYILGFRGTQVPDNVLVPHRERVHIKFKKEQ